MLRGRCPARRGIVHSGVPLDVPSAEEEDAERFYMAPVSPAEDSIANVCAEFRETANKGDARHAPATGFAREGVVAGSWVDLDIFPTNAAKRPA